MSEEKKEEVTEIEPEKRKQTWGVPEYIKDEDFPPLLPEVVEALDMAEPQQPEVSLPDIRVLIKMIGRRKNAFLILKLFYRTNDAYSATDLSKALASRMCLDAAIRNVKKLCDVGVLKAIRVPQFDKKVVYYTMANKEVVGYIVKDWLNRISYILGKVIPYRRVGIQQLKTNKKFMAICNEFALNFDEATDLLKKCPKIETEHHGSGVVTFSRRQQ